ncbi:hypothetical protein FJT64_008560 [Amphibalanus amphitrite]|uniref:Uncharacterized protein n=1 Tax=Amphibalanus amphitrite TaxID=1232801 RepID=A0A6A4VWF0_AMPAM|nr:hypothetical protein FJT64_008560 [Amphibalanus amphitrite]
MEPSQLATCEETALRELTCWEGADGGTICGRDGDEASALHVVNAVLGGALSASGVLLNGLLTYTVASEVRFHTPVNAVVVAMTGTNALLMLCAAAFSVDHFGGWRTLCVVESLTFLVAKETVLTCFTAVAMLRFLQVVLGKAPSTSLHSLLLTGFAPLVAAYGLVGAIWYREPYQCQPLDLHDRLGGAILCRKPPRIANIFSILIGSDVAGFVITTFCYVAVLWKVLHRSGGLCHTGLHLLPHRAAGSVQESNLSAGAVLPVARIGAGVVRLQELNSAAGHRGDVSQPESALLTVPHPERGRSPRRSSAIDTGPPAGEAPLQTVEAVLLAGEIAPQAAETPMATGETALATGETLLPAGETTLLPAGETALQAGETIPPAGERALLPAGKIPPSAGKALLPARETPPTSSRLAWSPVNTARANPWMTSVTSIEETIDTNIIGHADLSLAGPALVGLSLDQHPHPFLTSSEADWLTFRVLATSSCITHLLPSVLVVFSSSLREAVSSNLRRMRTVLFGFCCKK